VGPGGRKNKHSNPRPQVEAKDNEHHRASKRDVGYEEVAGRVKRCIDTGARKTIPDGTSPIENNGDYRIVGGGEGEHNVSIGRVHIHDPGGDHTASSRSTHKEGRAGPGNRKGTCKQVP
jgi:hypothetical protein